MKIIKKLRGYLKEHLVDATAINVVAVPVSAAMETSKKLCELVSKIPFVNVKPIPESISLTTRLFAMMLTYLGLGYVLSKGRDFSRKLTNIKETTHEGLQWVHDTLYLIIFNAIINPILYSLSSLLSGTSISSAEIIGGTINLSIFSLIAGWPIGYAIDVFKDLTGIKPCERKSYPYFIKKQKLLIKIILAIFLIVISIGATMLVYSLIQN